MFIQPISGGHRLPGSRAMGSRKRPPEAIDASPGDLPGLSLLAQYMAVSTAHEDRLQQLRWQVARQNYPVRSGELSRRIIDFYLAPDSAAGTPGGCA